MPPPSDLCKSNSKYHLSIEAPFAEVGRVTLFIEGGQRRLWRIYFLLQQSAELSPFLQSVAILFEAKLVEREALPTLHGRTWRGAQSDTNTTLSARHCSTLLNHRLVIYSEHITPNTMNNYSTLAVPRKPTSGERSTDAANRTRRLNMAGLVKEYTN